MDSSSHSIKFSLTEALALCLYQSLSFSPCTPQPIIQRHINVFHFQAHDDFSHQLLQSKQTATADGTATHGCRDNKRFEAAFHILRRQLRHHESNTNERINDSSHDTPMERSSRDNRVVAGASPLRQTFSTTTT